MKLYVVRSRECHIPIDWDLTEQEAIEEIERFEQEDKEDGTYTKDFYEYVEVKDQVNELSDIF